VGEEADDRVSAWKGPGRPVNAPGERAEVLAGLASVSAVFAIGGDPPPAAAPTT
jgi:bifunctional ADP-heptose synthase (sugar kinase/adenylyltransferase)